MRGFMMGTSPRSLRQASKASANLALNFIGRVGARENGMSTITDRSVLEAVKLVGLSYRDAERALMVDILAGQIELAVKRRATTLPMTLPPATLFDPRLPGFVMPAERGFRPSRATAPRLPE